MKKWFIFLLCIPVLHAQRPTDVYKKIGDVYANATSLSVQLEVRISYLPGANQPDLHYTGLIVKQQDNVYTRFDDKVNIQAGGKNLFVDAKTRLILISPVGKNENTLKKNLFSGFEDTLYLRKYEFHYLKSESGELYYDIVPRSSASEYSHITLAIDEKTYCLKKIIYEMNPDKKSPVEKIEISYTKTSLNEAVDEACFSWKPYVTEKNNVYKAAGSYSGYKVINQIQ